ncbi:MAG: helix-turn-helix domain-containing protein, partial [Pseudonocardiaceae bacterium]
MSLKAMTWVWDHSPAAGTELLVLLAIADNADDTGANAYPSTDTLARKTRLDTRTVQRVIRRLEKDGHVVVDRGGGRAANRYA